LAKPFRKIQAGEKDLVEVVPPSDAPIAERISSIQSTLNGPGSLFKQGRPNAPQVSPVPACKSVLRWIGMHLY